MPTTGSREIVVRDAVPADAKVVMDIARELLDYHRVTGSVLTQQMLERDIGSFSNPNKYFESFLASYNVGNEGILGYLMYFKKYSFMDGRVIWMENLFVINGYRNEGIGSILIKRLCHLAAVEDAIIQWECIDWNFNSIGFYEHIGAKKIYSKNNGWSGYELSKEAIHVILEEH